MTSAWGDPAAKLRTTLEACRAALARKDRAEARRLAREATRLAPHLEAPWLFLAAASDPRAGLAYLARALEINPRSHAARKAIRWMIRRLPGAEREAAWRGARLPEDLRPALLSLDRLALRRVFSLHSALPALGLALGVGLWFGGQPADARQPQRGVDPVAKATSTSTPTSTPTATPTSTPTPTPTSTATPTPTATPRPRISWTYSSDPSELADEGRWIDVDLSLQRVTAYEGADVVRSFIVSTGTWAHPTVTGQFRIWIKLTATDMSGPGYYLRNVPYTMYFYGGYALHGTYWHNNFGTPMSHGCVNLRTPDAEWLFHFASVGTLVNIHP